FVARAGPKNPSNKVCMIFLLALSKIVLDLQTGVHVFENVDKYSLHIYQPIMLNSSNTPTLANCNTKIAAIGEISIIPIGGIIFLNCSKYGSHRRAKNKPNCDSRAPGNQDIKI